MLHKDTGEQVALREERGVHVFDGWISLATTAGSKRSKVLSLTPSCGTRGFSMASHPSVSPQDEDQPMNPDDTVQVSEEVGGEGERNPILHEPVSTQQARREIQEHALTHPPPRSSCGHCLRVRGTRLPRYRSKTKEERVGPTVSVGCFFMGPSGHKVCSRCRQ